MRIVEARFVPEVQRILAGDAITGTLRARLCVVKGRQTRAVYPALLPEREGCADLVPAASPQANIHCASGAEEKLNHTSNFLLRNITHTLFPAIFAALIILSGCAKQQAAESQKAPPPAKVENAVKESELATIKLTPQAEQRLGITTAPVAVERVAQTRTFAGEVVLPPDRTTSVAAPISGTLSANSTPLVVGAFVRKGQPVYRLTPFLAPERDLRVQLERDIATTQTKVDAARVRFNRAEQLLRDRAGSEKSVEQAREELDIAENDLKAARTRLERYDKAPVSADVSVNITAPRDGMIQKVLANPGQTVAAGSPLFEVVNLASVWIRVPVYVGDLRLIDRRQSARVHALNEAPGEHGAVARAARPVNAPPSANPLNDTADLYFELANADGSLRPGQKMGVTLAERSTEESLVVPWSAVLHDTGGGTWVYENTAPQLYARRRVEVRRVVDKLAVLARGPAVSAKVVTAGAAELFGTEFGTGK
ncbi:MAG: efflux RND transporter periplasmic adaptor subunit [Acidobacteriota bacterium]|nr:efflux RND transporter periplasmic adaptor subunit [Acidobacteriota bacterium]